MLASCVFIYEEVSGNKRMFIIFEMERLAAEQNVKPAMQHTEDKPYVTAKTPKIPALDEGKDEMDSYLRRFERYAPAQKWKKEGWATSLSALLKGKALDVQSTLVISNSKGLTETLRNIRNSTYQS